MKLTKKHLEECIREELKHVLAELNPFHDKDGRFAKSGEEKTYSISTRAAKEHGINPKYALRGVVSGPYKTDEPGAGVKTPSGSGSGLKAAGRMEDSGKEIVPRYSLLHHDKKYQALNELSGELEGLDASNGYVAISAELLDTIIQSIQPYLSGKGFSGGGSPFPDPGCRPIRNQ